MTEIYNTKYNLAPPIMHHLRQFRENTFNLINFREPVNHNKKTSNYGLETLSCKVSLVWAKSLSECKNSTSLSEFKTKKQKIGKLVKFILADNVRITCQTWDTYDMKEVWKFLARIFH